MQKSSRGRFRKSEKKKKIDTFTEEDDCDKLFICHSTRRHVHQINYDYLSIYLKTRVDNGELVLKNDEVHILCCKKTGKTKCKYEIPLTRFQKVQKKHPELFVENNDVFTRAWIKAREIAGHIQFCPNVKCSGSQGFLRENLQESKTNCVNCGSDWCAECKRAPYHDGISCEMARASEEISLKNDKSEASLDKKYLMENTQLCSSCGRFIQKEEGCDHMKCECGAYFCYVCGQKLPEDYSKHLVYNERLDTYVCPKRLEANKTGLASSKIVHPEEEEAVLHDDVDSDGEERFDPALDQMMHRIANDLVDQMLDRTAREFGYNGFAEVDPAILNDIIASMTMRPMGRNVLVPPPPRIEEVIVSRGNFMPPPGSQLFSDFIDRQHSGISEAENLIRLARDIRQNNELGILNIGD